MKLLLTLLLCLPALGAGFFMNQQGLLATHSAPVVTPTPLDLSVGCIQYLRTPPAGAIASWTDESGNGNDATQGTTAKRPTGIDAAYNGKSCARFDGVDDVLAHSSVPGKACWLVIKGTTWNAAGSYVSGGSGAGWFADVTVAPFTTGPGGFDGTNVRSASTGNRIATGSLRTLLLTSTKVFVDGVEVGAYGNTGTLGTVSTAQVGSRTDVNWPFAFDLVEMAIFDGTPTSGDLAALQAWAEDEYGAP
jgi:hypothetical protein